MKVLVSAFKPFNNSKNNYSEEVLKYIENVDFVNRMIKMEYYDENIEIGGTYKNHLKEILD